jgi:hypothetical protein
MHLLIPAQEIFIIFTASRMATGLIQPPVQWEMEAFSMGVKQLGYEADHSPPSSDQVTNAWNYTSIFPYIFMVWHSLKQKGNFTFTFT